ncbi:oxygenase MpaB family protein [soil metagenome]
MEAVKVAIRRRINELFNDYERGERPALRRADALFPTDSVAWRVNGDIVTMMIGGVSGLLLQMLHPAVLAGVWDHSDFRADMHGRLRRTAKFIAVTTYDHASAGQAVIEKVRRIHDKLGGTLPDGAAYRVSDPTLLAWVHVTETTSFLDSWVRYGEPSMSAADQDAYLAEMARIGRALGADPVPTDRASAEALIQSMRPQLKADARTREVAALVMRQKVGGLAEDVAAGLIMQAGADLLPDWAREMHGLPKASALARNGARTMQRTLDWTYTGSPNRKVWPDDVLVWPDGSPR